MGATPPVKRPRRGMPARPRWELETPPGLKRGLGSPALFGIVQGFIAASIYFGLGLVVQAALGFAWLVYLVSAVFFGLVVLSYVEGASLHQERGGATIIARYAFNELWSFIAGWAILLDYILLIALTAFATTDYVAVLFPPLAGGVAEFLFGAAVVVGVAWLNIQGAGSKRYERFSFVVLGDLVLQTTIVILGLALLLNPDVLTNPASLAGTPSTSNLIFAFTLTLVTFAGVDASSGLAGEVAVSRRGLKRLVTARLLAFIPYVGISLVAVSVLPLKAGLRSGPDNYVDAPMLGVAAGFEQAWLSDTLRLLIGLSAFAILGDRVQRRDARPLAARLLARAQPPDPVRDRAPASDARDPGRDHRRRRAAGDPAADPGRPRVPRLDLRLRRDDLVHDRARLGLPPALARARPRPPVQGAAEPPHRPRRAAGDRRARRAHVGRRLRRRRPPPRQRALGRDRLDGVRDRALRDLPRRRRASRSSSASRSPSAR